MVRWRRSYKYVPDLPLWIRCRGVRNDLESDVIAFNRNTGMPRQKGAQTIARPITTSINPPKKTLKIRA